VRSQASALLAFLGCFRPSYDPLFSGSPVERPSRPWTVFGCLSAAGAPSCGSRRQPWAMANWRRT